MSRTKEPVALMVALVLPLAPASTLTISLTILSHFFDFMSMISRCSQSASVFRNSCAPRIATWRLDVRFATPFPSRPPSLLYKVFFHRRLRLCFVPSSSLVPLLPSRFEALFWALNWRGERPFHDDARPICRSDSLSPFPLSSHTSISDPVLDKKTFTMART